MGTKPIAIEIAMPRQGFISMPGAATVIMCIACVGAAVQGGSGEGIMAQCEPLRFALLPGGLFPPDDTEHVRRTKPADVPGEPSDFLYAQRMDVDCDGDDDFVAQSVRTEDQGGAFLAYVQDQGEWRLVLRSESAVDCIERVALAADVSGQRRRDLVVLGADEGGFIVRVFRWDGGTYRSVSVPPVYQIRHEEEWDASCLSKINPEYVPPDQLALLRETISPTSLRGHGRECDLPRDTLRIQGDALAPIR